jgi:SAM-dependent methyltransferase
MAKLTREQARMHAQACQLLEKDKLSLDEQYFVLGHWREDATHINSVSGAFFTPPALARDFAIEVSGARVIDLCAGTGSLAFAVSQRLGGDLTNVTCVEINPDYVAVGRKILPEATWIQADVLNLPIDIGHFDCAIANPPFGRVKANGRGPRFSGNVFEYRVIDIASDLADYGVFIIPQASAPFVFSGKSWYERNEHEKYRNFNKQTSIVLGPNCGIDTSVYRGDWTIVPPSVEIVTADFQEARQARTSRMNSTLGPPTNGAKQTPQLQLFPFRQRGSSEEEEASG